LHHCAQVDENEALAQKASIARKCSASQIVKGVV
jgi:hypothetical protein